MFQSRIVSRLPARVAHLLVRGRSLYYHLIEPFDAVCRRLNHKTDLPPVWLRRYVGPLEVFESASAEFACLLKTLAGLQPGSRLLDLGCGCGALALQLRRYIRASMGGAYIGLDVHRQSIEWCRAHFFDPGFHFAVLDAFNAAFRPDGNPRFDYEAALSTYKPVNIVAAKSLFTHLKPEDVQAYFRAIAKVVDPDGRLIFTAFLFDESDNLSTTAIKFPFGDTHFRHAYAHRVESAVAYSEAFMFQMLRDARLEIVTLYKGEWRADHGGVSFQDLVIARPEKPDRA